MQVVFRLIRQAPQGQPYPQDYTLEIAPGQTILDGLNHIKWSLDGSLAFRKNCRNTICGSCAMVINGRPALACQQNVASELVLADRRGELPLMTVAPLGNLPVIRDLVVDMQPFWQDWQRIHPYVSHGEGEMPAREFRQMPEVRARLDEVANCILCGACYSACNAKQVNEDFVGPHSLAKAQRLLLDDRDDQRDDRLRAYGDNLAGVWGCTRCQQCNSVCPKEVAPLDQISGIKQQVLARHGEAPQTSSRPIRHRRVLIDLVAEGGWVDERKFALLVVGNYFRDLAGLVSIGPLGWRMILRGKFPLGFEASAGVVQVAGLIRAIRDRPGAS